MTVEPLSSNVVNYLVWRYLQEAGYGNAALQLSRCWNRDPDSLPFAKNVAQHALINLLQDGLWFDKAQADASNNPRRYYFGRDHGRPYSSRNGELLTLDQGIPAHQLSEDLNGAVQEPPPRKAPVKRKKGGAKANGVPDVRMNSQNQVNGDAMEIDHNGHTHVTNSVRAESEAMASEPESPNVAEIPISTLSIGQSTEIQTEQPADLAPNTLFSCSVKDLDKHVTQTSWGVPEAPLLLAAGKSLLRLHVIQKNADANSSQPVHPLDLQLPLNNFSITAFCWNSHNEMTVSAQEELVNESGETMKTDKLLNVTDGGADTRVISSTAGLVTTLRWNASRRLLLAVSSDGQKGSVKIWKDSVDDQIPAWTAFTDTTIYDAIWTSESTFVICGDKIFQVYEIEETMKLQRSLNTHIQWEKIKQDPATNIVAALGIDGQTSYLGILEPGDPFNLKTQVYPDDYFTDLDFRPRHKTDVLGISYPTSPATSGSPLMLATCAASGFIRIWDANNPFQCLKRLSMADESSANNVSFSPDGALLAAAGPDAVTVWDLDKREVPLATWRAQDFGKGDWNPDVDGDFSLGWDPDGSRLSISLGNQIAIIPVPR